MVGQPMPPSRIHLITVPSLVPRPAITSASLIPSSGGTCTALSPRTATPDLLNSQQCRGSSWGRPVAGHGFRRNDSGGAGCPVVSVASSPHAPGHRHRRHRPGRPCSRRRTRAGRGAAPTRWPPPSPGCRRARRARAHGDRGEPQGATEQGRGRRHPTGGSSTTSSLSPVANTLIPGLPHSRTARPRRRAPQRISSRLTPSTSAQVSAH